MGCFFGGVHDSSPKLFCPFHIWLPLPSTSRELKTNPRHRASTVLGSSVPTHSQVGPGKGASNSPRPSHWHTVSVALAEQAQTPDIPFLLTTYSSKHCTHHLCACKVGNPNSFNFSSHSYFHLGEYECTQGVCIQGQPKTKRCAVPVQGRGEEHAGSLAQPG